MLRLANEEVMRRIRNHKADKIQKPRILQRDKKGRLLGVIISGTINVKINTEMKITSWLKNLDYCFWMHNIIV